MTGTPIHNTMKNQAGQRLIIAHKEIGSHFTTTSHYATYQEWENMHKKDMDKIEWVEINGQREYINYSDELEAQLDQ